MYLALPTFGGAGGAGAETFGAFCASGCAPASACCGGGTGFGASPIWRARCAKTAPGDTAAANSRSDRDLLANFIWWTSFREARKLSVLFKDAVAPGFVAKLETFSGRRAFAARPARRRAQAAR